MSKKYMGIRQNNQFSGFDMWDYPQSKPLFESKMWLSNKHRPENGLDIGQIHDIIYMLGQ